MTTATIFTVPAASLRRATVGEVKAFRTFFCPVGMESNGSQRVEVIQPVRKDADLPGYWLTRDENGKRSRCLTHQSWFMVPAFK